MPEREDEMESTGSLIGGLITWSLIAIVLFAVMTSGIVWIFWALFGWVALLVLDILQAQLRNKQMYVRVLSELWTLPF